MNESCLVVTTGAYTLISCPYAPPRCNIWYWEKCSHTGYVLEKNNSHVFGTSEKCGQPVMVYCLISEHNHIIKSIFKLRLIFKIWTLNSQTVICLYNVIQELETYYNLYTYWLYKKDVLANILKKWLMDLATAQVADVKINCNHCAKLILNIMGNICRSTCRMSAHLYADVKMEFVFVRMVTMEMTAVSVSTSYIMFSNGIYNQMY